MRPETLLSATLLLLAAAGCAPRSGAPIEEGTVLEARDEQGASVTLRVESVARDPQDADGDVFLYELAARDGAGAFHPYCLPDREGRTLAIPVQGSWDAQRNHVPGDGITFACTNGAIAKCVRFGYKPWKTVNGVSLADYHQACVHLVGADYCGDGQPHTREGTKVDLWDRLGIQKRETEPGMVFEAAWSPRGAVYLHKPRYADPLAELSAACPDRLGGRTPFDGPELDAPAAAARWPEALIFTESFVQSERP
jgi:hypothetical protein